MVGGSSPPTIRADRRRAQVYRSAAAITRPVHAPLRVHHSRALSGATVSVQRPGPMVGGSRPPTIRADRRRAQVYRSAAAITRPVHAPLRVHHSRALSGATVSLQRPGPMVGGSSPPTIRADRRRAQVYRSAAAITRPVHAPLRVHHSRALSGATVSLQRPGPMVGGSRPPTIRADRRRAQVYRSAAAITRPVHAPLRVHHSRALSGATVSLQRPRADGRRPRVLQRSAPIVGALVSPQRSAKDGALARSRGAGRPREAAGRAGFRALDDRPPRTPVLVLVTRPVGIDATQERSGCSTRLGLSRGDRRRAPANRRWAVPRLTARDGPAGRSRKCREGRWREMSAPAIGAPSPASSLAIGRAEPRRALTVRDVSDRAGRWRAHGVPEAAREQVA